MKTVLERSDQVLSNELLNYVKCSRFFSYEHTYTKIKPVLKPLEQYHSNELLYTMI